MEDLLYELVSREYWWPGLSQFTKNYIDGCAVCQATKNRPHTQVPIQLNLVPAGVWKSITMDFVTDLPESQNADYMFIVVDRFSKAIIITPCHKTITAEETAQLYLDNIWRRTSLPQHVSDRGPQFASKLMHETWSKLNVNQALSTAFHP
jgi:Integrase zinc binding domain/Integrase core domain